MEQTYARDVAAKSAGISAGSSCLNSNAVNSQRIEKANLSNELIGRIGARLQALQMLNTRLSNVADRVTGPQPQAETGGNDRTEPGTLAGKLDLLDGFLTRLEMDVRNNVERLEQFV